MKKIILITLLGLLGYAASSSATEIAIKQLEQANTLYQKGGYEEATKLYEALVAQDMQAPALYFNLGNAYYKQGHLAAAILNYERAHKLAPGDEDINFNLHLANSRTVDKIALIPEIFYQRWFNSIRNTASATSWGVTSIVLFIICLIGFALFAIVIAPAFKRIYFFCSSLLLIFSAFTFIMALQSSNNEQNTTEAIVFESSVYVKSSPDEKSTDLFILHEGTKVQLVDSLQGWKKIKLANGNVGWVASLTVTGI